jgi:hypothetical protein
MDHVHIVEQLLAQRKRLIESLLQAATLHKVAAAVAQALFEQRREAVRATVQAQIDLEVVR